MLIPFKVGGLYVLREHLPVVLRGKTRSPCTWRNLGSLLQYTGYDERYYERYYELKFKIVTSPTAPLLYGIHNSEIYYRFPFIQATYKQVISGIVALEREEDIVLYVGSAYLTPDFSSIFAHALEQVLLQ